MPDLLHHAYLPNAEFTRAIEDAFAKDDPEHMVAWDRDPVPAWAQDFRPQTIFDIGTGLGGTLVAILTRLGQWGCLDDLQRIVMFDKDPRLHEDGPAAWKRRLAGRISSCIARYTHRPCSVAPVLLNLTLGSGSGLTPINHDYPLADLIVASHVSYFFDDGSGEALSCALLAGHLKSSGIIWLNIRDRDCAVYRKRSEVFAELGIEDPQSKDYSEYFTDRVLPGLAQASLLDRAAVEVDAKPGSDRIQTAELLMWRTRLDDGDEDQQTLRAAAAAVGSAPGPLYSETQYILAHAGLNSEFSGDIE